MIIERASAPKRLKKKKIYRLIIGPNAEYFLPRFRAFSKKNSKANWNWAAFFFSGVWLLYRKLYFQVLILFLFLFSVNLAVRLAPPEYTPAIQTLHFLPMLYFGLYGNWLYFKRVQRLAIPIKDEVSSIDDAIDSLGRKTGVSIVLPIVLCTLPIVIIGFALIFPKSNRNFTRDGIGSGLIKLFSTGTYDECVIEKMRGQDPSMKRFVSRACEKLYPFEREIQETFHFRKGDIEISWCVKLPPKVSACIERNNSDYRITRAIVRFTKEACGSEIFAMSNSREIEFVFPERFPKADSTLEEAESYQCMHRSKIFGIRR